MVLTLLLQITKIRQDKQRPARRPSMFRGFKCALCGVYSSDGFEKQTLKENAVYFFLNLKYKWKKIAKIKNLEATVTEQKSGLARELGQWTVGLMKTLLKKKYIRKFHNTSEYRLRTSSRTRCPLFHGFFA